MVGKTFIPLTFLFEISTFIKFSPLFEYENKFMKNKLNSSIIPGVRLSTTDTILCYWVIQYWLVLTYLLDLAPRRVVAALGLHDHPPSVTVPGFCGSFPKAQSTSLLVSSKQILPPFSRSSDLPSSSHLGIHLFFSLVIPPPSSPHA